MIVSGPTGQELTKDKLLPFSPREGDVKTKLLANRNREIQKYIRWSDWGDIFKSHGSRGKKSPQIEVCDDSQSSYSGGGKEKRKYRRSRECWSKI